MPLTIVADPNAYNTPIVDVPLGPYRLEPVRITFDNSYPTGGESVRVAGSPIPERSKIVGFFLHGAENVTAAINNFYYIPSTERIMVVVGAAGVNAQVANTTDLSGVTIYGTFLVWG